MEPKEQVALMEPKDQVALMEPKEQAALMEPKEQAALMEPKQQAALIEPEEQVAFMEPNEQAALMEQQAALMEPKEQAALVEPKEQDALIEPRGQVGTIKLDRPAETIDPKMQSKNIKFTEHPGSSRSTKQVEIHTECTGKTEPLLDQSHSSPLYVNFKLSNFVDVQQLLNIGYRNPEILPLVKRISVVGEIMEKFNPHVQSELVAIIKVVEKTIKEFVYMKSTAYDSDAMVETVYRLLPKLSKSFSHVVLKQGDFILDPALKNLAEWKKLSAKLSKKRIRKRPGTNIFDLSMRFKMKDLIKVGHDHPEFRKNIKTVLGVNAAMKHLSHEGQVEIYKVLCCIEKIIKDLVQEKTNPGGCQDIFLTPEALTSSLDYCIEKILKYLKTPPRIPVPCLQCDIDRGYVRNVHIKPVLGTLTQPRVKEHVCIPQQKTIFECANWGVSHDCIKNLESLIHHLAAKSGAIEHAWLFENCVDWFQIASLFADYKSKTRQDMERMQTLKPEILMKLEQMENAMVGAKEFCSGMKNVPLAKNETLSDSIALSGELDMLASDVDYYFKMFDRIIKELLRSKKEYTTLSTTIRDNRLLFLTKTQWKAFDFPFY